MGICGCFGDQQCLKSFVGILPKLHCIYRGRDTLDLEAAAMGEMLVGIPSRDPSAISVLAWDDVSTSWSNSFDFWGKGTGMITGAGCLGVKFLDPQPDVSSTTWDRRFLTSIVMLPSPSDLGDGFTRLATMVVETSPRGNTLGPAPPPGMVGYPFPGRQACRQ